MRRITPQEAQSSDNATRDLSLRRLGRPAPTAQDRHAGRAQGCVGHRGGLHRLPKAQRALLSYQLFPSGEVLHPRPDCPVRRARPLVVPLCLVLEARDAAANLRDPGQRVGCRLRHGRTRERAPRRGEGPVAKARPRGANLPRGAGGALRALRGRRFGEEGAGPGAACLGRTSPGSLVRRWPASGSRRAQGGDRPLLHVARRETAAVVRGAGVHEARPRRRPSDRRPPRLGPGHGSEGAAAAPLAGCGARTGAKEGRRTQVRGKKRRR